MLYALCRLDAARARANQDVRHGQGQTARPKLLAKAGLRHRLGVQIDGGGEGSSTAAVVQSRLSIRFQNRRFHGQVRFDGHASPRRRCGKNGLMTNRHCRLRDRLLGNVQADVGRHIECPRRAASDRLIPPSALARCASARRK